MGPRYDVYLGDPLDMGTITIAPPSGVSLTGTVAVLALGTPGNPLVTWHSDSPPASGSIVWNDSTGKLKVDLPVSVITTLGPGPWWYSVGVELAGVRVTNSLMGQLRVSTRV